MAPKRPANAAMFPLLGATLALAALAACEGLDVQPGTTGLLQVFAEPSISQAAEWAIDKYDADKRYRGTMILANKPFAGEELYIKLFIDNASDPDSGVRTAATRALGNHGGPEHVPVILKSLQDPDKLVRLEAARALQRVHNPIAIDPLIKECDDRKEIDSEVRAEAADALGQYAEPRVLASLQKSMADSNLSVNYSALRSLRTLTGQDFGLDRLAWRLWLDQSGDPFKARLAYTYPVFRRDKTTLEYVPFVPGPPNEPEGATPAGLPQGGEPVTPATGDKTPPEPPK